MPPKMIGAPKMIRTSDTRFRKPLLYPLSYPGMNRKISRRKSHARRENLLFQYLEMTSVAFEPPKPKLLLIA